VKRKEQVTPGGKKEGPIAWSKETGKETRLLKTLKRKEKQIQQEEENLSQTRGRESCSWKHDQPQSSIQKPRAATLANQETYPPTN